MEIRLIDIEGKTLARVDDGGFISVRFANGSIKKKQVKYVEDGEFSIDGIAYDGATYARVLNNISAEIIGGEDGR